MIAIPAGACGHSKSCRYVAGTKARSTAFAILEATIGSERLGIAAWYARDAAETSAFLASGGVPRWTSAERRSLAAAHAAAEDAALALLTHDRLPSADFAILLAPFAHLLPHGEPLLPAS